MAICNRCKRALKKPEAVQRGYGDVCWAKVQASKSSQSEGDNDLIVPYDGGDIFIERLEPERGTVSTIRTNIQRTEYRHSPTGFNFGYGGSGPADAALNIMLMFADKATANKIYQEFKREFLGQGGDEGVYLTIKKAAIVRFIQERKGRLTQKELDYA